MNPKLKKDVLIEIGDNFRQFSRNGRFGTCASCPRDNSGNAYPEFCVLTSRYDHNLDIDSLSDMWKRYSSSETTS